MVIFIYLLVKDEKTECGLTEEERKRHKRLNKGQAHKRNIIIFNTCLTKAT